MPYAWSMATAARRLPINAPGPLFVDDTCIDCGTCWSLAPATFEERGSTSRVARQPEAPDERARAFMALVSCPTASIGTTERAAAREVAAAARALPVPVTDGVYACGYASADSYGATSWLIARPGGRNVLVDSPRAAGPLLRRLEQLGGVETMFLTHRDDVADHRRFRERFGCRRVLHRDDVSRSTADVELQPEGREPLRLDDELLVVPVPGHTRGSAALLWRDVLFTGDHLWGEGDRLGAGPGVCWWSWSEQVRSMERLLELEFTWVLPGHGERFHAASPRAMRAELERLVAWMRRAR